MKTAAISTSAISCASFAFGLALVGCGSGAAQAPALVADVAEPSNVAEPPPPPPPPAPTCLVLSVGAEKGLSHIGVIEVVREKEIEIDCVVGTSMGSLVGALYANSPEGDLGAEYRSLFQAYVKETKSDAAERGIFWFLAGAAAVALSGGTAGPALAAGAGAGAVGAYTTEEKDIERLRDVMDEYFEQRRIEDLAIQYRTIHQRVGETGISQVPIRGGNLAAEVSWSVANPLIFPGIKLKSGARIDPGADSVAAVPLEYACREFPDHQFIVSNVTGEEVFTSKEINCPFVELRSKKTKVDRGKAIIGEQPDFNRLIESGRKSAATLDPTRFPKKKTPHQTKGSREPTGVAGGRSPT